MEESLDPHPDDDGRLKRILDAGADIAGGPPAWLRDSLSLDRPVRLPELPRALRLRWS